MDEPTRIGLTALRMAQLEEILEDLNPIDGMEGTKLIKFDLYRLLVAIGIKNRINPPALNDKSINNFRVSELDEDGILLAILVESKLVSDGISNYDYIERLAEHGVGSLYETFITTGQLPFEDYFSS